MFSLKAVRVLRPCLQAVVERNLHMTVPLLQQAKSTQNLDPIQELFLMKVREYNKKKAALPEGKLLVDASPADEKNLQDELQRINDIFKLTPETALQPAKFEFKDPNFNVEYVENDVFYNAMDEGNPYLDFGNHGLDMTDKEFDRACQEQGLDDTTYSRWAGNWTRVQ